MSSNKPIYKNRTSGGRHGDVFTSQSVVYFMLDKVGYTSNLNLQNMSILEPSCGEGEFIVEIAKRLKRSAERFNFDAEAAFVRNIQAFDIDAEKVDVCRKKVKNLGFSNTDNIQVHDYLKADISPVDIVVGNPPYIRYENIPSEMLSYCKEKFATFHYRSDLYIPFFEKTLSNLKDGGIHCFICSNRWIKNEYGKKLRQYISSSFGLQMLINMEMTNAFQEEVLAYPAITLISATKDKHTFEYAEVHTLNELINFSSENKSTPKGDDWSNTFIDPFNNQTLIPIEEQGFKIGIGVATGADAIFISENLINEVEPELILPAINAKDLKGDIFQWKNKFLLNPYDNEGKLINLDEYPKAKLYLEKHRDKLSRRHIAIKSPERWYRTIDRIIPSLQFQAKILLPDISGNKLIFVDEGHFYPLHNLYYITGDNITTLYSLAALLMSDFARNQLSAISNKMNGGYPRWQSQHLRKLRLPDIMSIPTNDLKILLNSYKNHNIAAINSIVDKILKWQRTRLA